MRLYNPFQSTLVGHLQSRLHLTSFFIGKDDSDLEHLIALSKREMSGNRKQRSRDRAQSGRSDKDSALKDQDLLSPRDQPMPDRSERAMSRQSSGNRSGDGSNTNRLEKPDNKAPERPIEVERPIKGVAVRQSDDRPIPSLQNNVNQKVSVLSKLNTDSESSMEKRSLMLTMKFDP